MTRPRATFTELQQLCRMSDAELSGVLQHPGSTRRLQQLAQRESDVRGRVDVARQTGVLDLPAEAVTSRPRSTSQLPQSPGTSPEPRGDNLPRPGRL